MPMIYLLHSVGSAVDPATETLWPLAIDGTVVRDDEGVHLSDTIVDWFDALDQADARLIGTFHTRRTVNYR